MTRRDFHHALAAGLAAGPLIRFDPAARAFTIDSGAIRKVLRLGEKGGLELQFFGPARGRNLAASASRWGADLYVSSGPNVAFGLADSGRFRFLRHEAASDELRLAFAEPEAGLEYTLYTRAFPGLAVLEHRVGIRNAGSRPVAIERTRERSRRSERARRPRPCRSPPPDWRRSRNWPGGPERLFRTSRNEESWP